MGRANPRTDPDVERTAAGSSVCAPRDRLVCVGVVARAHGLRGEVHIRSYTADPADLGAYGPLYDEGGEPAIRVHVQRVVKGQVVARVDGIEDRGAAEALKGLHLYVPRTALPEPGEEEYYHADLIGLRAELVGGRVLGTIRAIYDFSAGDVLEIARGKEVVMVPFTRAVVPEVDLARGRVVVDPPPGLIEDPGAETSSGEDGT